MSIKRALYGPLFDLINCKQKEITYSVHPSFLAQNKKEKCESSPAVQKGLGDWKEIYIKYNQKEAFLLDLDGTIWQNFGLIERVKETIFQGNGLYIMLLIDSLKENIIYKRSVQELPTLKPHHKILIIIKEITIIKKSLFVRCTN